jgi:hypothetical protein
LVEVGVYPPELTLLQNGVSLKDQERLGEYKKWLYYYFIMTAQQKENKMLEEKMKEINTPRGGDYTGRTKSIRFPDDFVSRLEKLRKKGVKNV